MTSPSACWPPRDAAGERVWRLPLVDEYRENLKSDVADMNNVGPRGGGAITAGLFLEGVRRPTGRGPTSTSPGPAFLEKDTPLAPKGGTGCAVRPSSASSRIPAGRV